MLARILAAAILLAPLAASQDDFEKLAQRAESLLDQKPQEAAELYKQALAMRPDWAEGWLYRGAALYQIDHYAEATDAFRKGIAIQPQQGTAWAFVGLCEAELDNPEQALADILKGEQIGLGSNRQFEVAVRVKAAQLLIESSSFDEVMAQLQPLASRGDDAPQITMAMGLSVLAIAERPSKVAPEKRPIVDLAGRAAWYSASQYPARAAPLYKQLVESYENEWGVHYAYGLYMMETDVSTALEQFRIEVKNNPKHWPSYIIMASLEIKQGATDTAIEHLRQAMKIAPTKYRWMCHAEIGRANLTADNLPTAISEFQTAIRLMPNNAQLHFHLSQAYRRAGKKEEAQRESLEFQKLKVQEDPMGVPSLRPFKQ